MTLIAFDWDLAAKLNSSDKAIILNMIRVSIFYKETNKEYDPLKSKYFMDGVWWMQDSFQAWQQRLPWLSMSTIKRYFAELFENGYLQKKIVAVHGGGREAAFYRVPTVVDESRKSQIDPNDESAKMTPAKCQNETFLESVKMRLSSSTINQAINPAKNQRSAKSPAPFIPPWQLDHPFAAIFEQLTKLPVCAKQFDLKTYTDELQALKGELAITDSKMLEYATAWQKWHNTPGGKKPQKAWMNFEGWVKRSYQWDPEIKKDVSARKEKPQLQDTFANMVETLKEHNRLKQLNGEQNG